MSQQRASEDEEMFGEHMKYPRRFGEAAQRCHCSRAVFPVSYKMLVAGKLQSMAMVLIRAWYLLI